MTEEPISEDLATYEDWDEIEYVYNLIDELLRKITYSLASVIQVLHQINLYATRVVFTEYVYASKIVETYSCLYLRMFN
jgi:hypothetical protein